MHKQNLTAENTKKEEEQLKEDRHNIEKHLSSKPNFLLDNDDSNDEGDSGDKILYFNDGKLVIMIEVGGYWVIKKDVNGNTIDAYKVITDPILDAQESCRQAKKQAAEEWNKMHNITRLFPEDERY
jgi:hypothetical protein